eukprot:2396350-Alexandrium_andersonii.AAC.1
MAAAVAGGAAGPANGALLSVGGAKDPGHRATQQPRRRGRRRRAGRLRGRGRGSPLRHGRGRGRRTGVDRGARRKP